MKTEAVKLTADTAENDIILKKAAEIIKRGGLVAFPTETVYGLGANALDSTASAKIYAAKGRPSDNPLIIHISSADDAGRYAYVPQIYGEIAKAFIPGPITAIMKKRDIIPFEVTGGLDSVAVRVPAHPIARRLIELAGVPIAAPSANLSGRPSPTRAEHVIEDLSGRVDMIIDGGPCDIGLESTIIKLDGERPTLLRPGGVTYEQLKDTIGEVDIDRAVLEKLGEGERPLAPGMKYRHYAPKAPLTLIDGDEEAFLTYVAQRRKSGTAVIAYEEDICKLKEIGYNSENILSLGSRSDVASHAAKLFALLRKCDSCGFTDMYAHMPTRMGLSLALYNRILKASGYNVVKLSDLDDAKQTQK